MRTVRRWWRWAGMSMLLGVVLLFAIRFAWPKDQLLLHHAIRIGDATDFEGWASDHEFLRFHFVGPMMHLPVMTRCNIRTGQEKSFPVTKAVASTHSAVMPSPDGRWVLCWDAVDPKPNDKVTALNLQTGASVSWPSEGDAYHCTNVWIPDSHRWLQLTTDPANLFNVDVPSQHIKIPLPDNFPDHPECLMTTSAHLLAYGVSRHATPNPQAINLREYSLLPHLVLLRALHVSLPSGSAAQESEPEPEFSPAGDRIAWESQRTVSSPLARLHRWIPMIPVKSIPCVSLWVSRIDGRDMHEIGYIPMTDDDSLYPKWLPDGKRLSFIYKQALYTVPAD